MSYQDKTCDCRDCGQKFIFSAREQEEFKHRGFNHPTRCLECHNKRNARRKYNRGGDCQTHTAPCAICGKDANLPFKPAGDKPVYCTECFRGRLSAKTESGRKEFTLRAPEKLAQEANEPIRGESGAITSFADFNLDPRLERAIRELGYETPTPVQVATIPMGLMGRDLIGTAQTGTGKTAAFVLPILQHLLTNPVAKPRTRVVVLTPTRELAEQINESFKLLGKFTKIVTATVYGGVGMNPQERALRSGAEVIVACPGRLLDHIDRGTADLSNVEKLVLDEADRMLDMGFLPPIKRILARLPRKRHSMLFSATFAPELMQLVENTLNDPQRIDIDLRAPATTVAHALYPCPQHLKTSLVLELLDKTDANSVLIFTRTKHRANRVAQQIGKAGYGTAALHANKSQNQRQLALDDFRSGKCQILVATDIAARGLDIETISHVINYDIPDTSDTYIHRIGRTGRAEREGDAMTLVTSQDSPIVWDIEKALGVPIERRKLDSFDYNAPAPSVDEFKRAPMPRRNPNPRAGRVTARR
ncbi:MAG: DEAD/DEAH box helicase [Armatimonadetes bacterium]|nr:DEAD/DEAH box helicase [Armatimonadota bacterium]